MEVDNEADEGQVPSRARQIGGMIPQPPPWHLPPCRVGLRSVGGGEGWGRCGLGPPRVGDGLIITNTIAIHRFYHDDESDEDDDTEPATINIRWRSSTPGCAS
jgi:hypothetical protein